MKRSTVGLFAGLALCALAAAAHAEPTPRSYIGGQKLCPRPGHSAHWSLALKPGRTYAVELTGQPGFVGLVDVSLLALTGHYARSTGSTRYQFPRGTTVVHTVHTGRPGNLRAWSLKVSAHAHPSSTGRVDVRVYDATSVLLMAPALRHLGR
jgi:hypothetical protein